MQDPIGGNGERRRGSARAQNSEAGSRHFPDTSLDLVLSAEMARPAASAAIATHADTAGSLAADSEEDLTASTSEVGSVTLGYFPAFMSFSTSGLSRAMRAVR